MIGDGERARRLQGEYRDLKAVREAGYGREVVEQKIASLLTELWEVEGRLLAEGLHITSEGELVAIPFEAAA